MNRTEVKFTIKNGGSIEMDVLNGIDETCVVATQELEVSLSNLGGVKEDEGKKPEYYSGGTTNIFNDLSNTL